MSFSPRAPHRPLRFRAVLPTWRVACSLLVVVAVWWAALALPRGLTLSHGSAVLSAALHETLAEGAAGLGHAHGHDGDASGAGGHAHHAGDHFHETAHVPPGIASLPGAAVAAWSASPPGTLPRPDPRRLERPPPG
jgi:hypothetical protein